MGKLTISSSTRLMIPFRQQLFDSLASKRLPRPHSLPTTLFSSNPDSSCSLPVSHFFSSLFVGASLSYPSFPYYGTSNGHPPSFEPLSLLLSAAPLCTSVYASAYYPHRVIHRPLAIHVPWHLQLTRVPTSRARVPCFQRPVRGKTIGAIVLYYSSL